MPIVAKNLSNLSTPRMAGASEKPGNGGIGRSAATALSVGTLGKLTLRAGEHNVGPIGRKSAALIAYLALSGGGEETRERVVGLLWSETEEGKARASLRQALHEIREAFDQAGFEGLHTDKV